MEFMTNMKKLAMAGLLVALGVVCSAFYIPIGASKCFPIQHMVNVLAGVLLGPWYACGMAFATSFLRVILSMGTLLAFPGSMIGALLCGLLYRYSNRLSLAFLGEVVGTGMLGGMISYPIALLVLGNETAALFTYVLPFLISSFGGSVFSIVLIVVLQKAGALKTLHLDLKLKF